MKDKDYKQGKKASNPRPTVLEGVSQPSKSNIFLGDFVG